MTLLPRKQLVQWSSRPMKVGPHCQTLNNSAATSHFVEGACSFHHFTTRCPTILRPHHFFTTDHASPQLHSPASDTGTAAGSGSDDDGDDGMLPCKIPTPCMGTCCIHGNLGHPWAPTASMGTYGIRRYLQYYCAFDGLFVYFFARPFSSGTANATGPHQRTLEGHNDVVRAVASSPDGETLASATERSGSGTRPPADARGHGNSVNANG